jgi:succinoglycan biosynthesis transport protein ExoP
MLQRTQQRRELSYDGPDELHWTNGAAPRRLDLHDIYTFVKSNWRIIAAWTIVAVALALGYSFTATPLYTATAELALDSRKVQVFNSKEQVVGDASLDSSQVESEVTVLRSESIALAVVKELKLTDDSEFVDDTPGLFSWLFGSKGGLSDELRTRIAVSALRGRLVVRRLGPTHVLEISFRSRDRMKAARIANAAAQAYLREQLNVKYEAAGRASAWLQERIAELRNQSSDAARAVEAYKEKHNIVDTGAGRGLLSDLQVQELNSQMISATAATAEAKARLNRIDEVLKSPAPGEALGNVSESLHSEVITRLRQRYLTDREHVVEFTAKMGPNHTAVLTLKNQMAELQNSMIDELQRIAQSSKSDYEIAKAREDSLRASLGKQVQTAGATGQAVVDLKELQAASQTYHTIFENFLQKNTEAVQEQTFPIFDAHVITVATPPLSKSHPKTTLIALLGLVVGVAGGLGHSLVRHNFDRSVRRPRDVEERLRLNCLGLVPLIVPRESPQAKSEAAKLSATAGRVGPLVVKRTPAPNSVPDLTHKATDNPFSHFSERMRSIKTALDGMAQLHPVQCIGVISAVPGEGKSTVAVNLAQAFARGGRPTLLIDADLRSAQLSRLLLNDADYGLVELMAGSVPLSQATRILSGSKLCFVPAVLRRRIANSGDLLASERMHTVLTAARHGFDQVIIDLPPVGAISDARAIAPLVDAFVLVVNWGSTRFDVVEQALSDFGIAADKIVGVVLNKVNFRELDIYSRGYYHNKLYAKYGYTYEQEPT